MGMGGYALPPALPAPSEWTSFDGGARGALPDMFRQASLRRPPSPPSAHKIRSRETIVLIRCDRSCIWVLHRPLGCNAHGLSS